MKQNRNHIQIILVLYKTNLSESSSYIALRNGIKFLTIPYSILIYNNSPEIEIKSSSLDETVINSSSNKMLAGAYNEALEIAIKNNSEWLLILDQDTELTAEYFHSLNQFLLSDNAKNYDIVVPVLKKNEIQLSPIAYKSCIGPFWTTKNINVTSENISTINENLVLSAFNSATALRIDAITQIGGFDENFPLDMLDHRYYYQLHNNHCKMWVLPVWIQQNLSLLDSEHQMSVQRYDKYLQSCLQFAKSISILCVLSQKLRLCFHIGSQILHTYKRKYLKYSLKNLFLF